MHAIQTFFAEHQALHLPYVLIAIGIWSLAWKGIGLWFSARNYQKGWFVAILILNTFSVLSIIYLIWFRRDKQEGVTKSLFDEPLAPHDDAEVAGTASA